MANEVALSEVESRREGKALLIDTCELYQEGATRTLEPERSQQIYEWNRDYEDVEGRVATLEEISHNDWNLNIPHYVELVFDEETIMVSEAVDNLKEALQAASAAENRLKELLAEAGFIGEGNAV